MSTDIDYARRTQRFERGRPHKQRECIPIDAAREAYSRLKNWRLVAEEIRRSNGTKYQPYSIKAAVLYADKGNAGRLIGGR